MFHFDISKGFKIFMAITICKRFHFHAIFPFLFDVWVCTCVCIGTQQDIHKERQSQYQSVSNKDDLQYIFISGRQLHTHTHTQLLRRCIIIFFNKKVKKPLRQLEINAKQFLINRNDKQKQKPYIYIYIFIFFPLKQHFVYRHKNNIL